MEIYRARTVVGIPWLALIHLLLGMAWVEAEGPSVAVAKEPIFTDRAVEMGMKWMHFNGGTGELYFPEINGSGSALLDVDNDGDLDLFLLQGKILRPKATLANVLMKPPEGQPPCDRLYRNDLDVAAGAASQKWVDVTESAGILSCGYGTGVGAGDYDNDGWMDIYVSNYGPGQMWHNNGDGTFTDTTDSTGTSDPRWSVPAVFLDYDLDGWLDLFVGNYAGFRLANHKDCNAQAGYPDFCGPKSYDPVPDRLMHNRGDGTFEEVTLASGLSKEYGYSLGAVPGDFDGDGWMDIYVANDGVQNQLWINQQDGTFLNDALLAGCAVNAFGQPEASMGVDAGDFDGDGDLDLFMTHISSETNTLYVNDGTGFFDDRTVAVGLGSVSFKYTGFGTAFFDYDNDGWLDLLVVNGAVVVMQDLMQKNEPFPFHQPNQLFHNVGGGQFEEVSDAAGPGFSISLVSRGAAFGDLDNDGDTDVVVTNNNGPVQLLINNVGNKQQWLGVSLRNRHGRRDVVGAVVGAVRSGRPTLWQPLRTAGGYASANDPRVLLGLGSAGEVSEVRVRWPGGKEETWRGIPSGQYTELVEGSGKTID